MRRSHRIRRKITESELLAALRERGATKLQAVHFKANRRTIWSVTRGGTVLNLHEGFRGAAPDLIGHFARIAIDPRGRSRACAVARRALRLHGPLHEALVRIRAEPGRRRRNGRRRSASRVGPNCATPGQQEYLESLYRILNRTRFHDRLPTDVPIRLSSRMRSTYGWVTLHTADARRQIGELALQLDLMLEENDRRRIDVMLHEMAHIEVWLRDGTRGHGDGWKAVARRVGCEPTACTGQKITRRRDGRARIERVPPLPSAADLVML